MKLKNEQIKEIVDKETGEVQIITTQKTFSIKSTSEEFFIIYTKFLSVFYGLTSLSDIKLFIKFCQLAQFDKGIVLIPTEIRKEIYEELNISSSQFSRSIKSLKSKKLIEGTKGKFRINPTVFWKGSEKTREKVMKDEIELTVKML